MISSGNATVYVSNLDEAIHFYTRQLGLKLEMRKRPMKVLVIDSMQEKPIE